MIKKGLKVRVLTGKDKKKEGEVIEIDRSNNRAKIKGLNLVKKHMKTTKEKKGGIISKENFINFNTLMMSKSNGDLLKDETLYLNDSIEYFFNFFKSKYKLHTNTYKIYGHSAGAQFVHRYLLITQEPAVDQAVIANAGWYTVISDNNYPYGIRNIPVEFKGNQLKNFLDYRISLLIGSDDIGNTSLNTSEGAMLQGLNRYQRAENFFDYLLMYGEQKNLPVRWKYQVVEGAIHSNEKMAPSAFNILFYDIK